MNGFANIKRTFYKIDEKLENSRLLFSVRRGLTLMIPLLLIGSFALIIISLPVPAYQSVLLSIFGAGWKNLFIYIRDGTFGILSLIMVLCISYSYACENYEQYAKAVNPLITSIVSLSSFVALSGLSKEGFSVADFGVMGVFFAIVVAVISSKLFIKLCSFGIFQMKAFTDGANSAFNDAITSIYPASITILIFAVLNVITVSVFGISNIQSFLSNFLSSIFLKLGTTLWSATFFIFLIHFFWFFGMHGNNILEPVAQGLFAPALSTNINLINHNQAPTEIFTKTFFDTFVLLGGCGSTLCLICAVFIISKLQNLRRHAKMSVVPALFNINELVVFGIPIVLNPLYIIPFIFTPVILTLISYLAMFYDLVPYTSKTVEWTTPIFLSGYTSTNSIQGSLLQLFNLVVGILCYIPFVKIAEQKALNQMSNNLEKIYSILGRDEEQGVISSFITRHGDVGNTSRLLAADLEHCLQNNKLQLFYQPQVDYNGCVFGIEALLRWEHDIYGHVYPPLIIALAEEAHLIDKLGYWIMDTACRDLKELNRQGFKDLTLSVNVSAHQLESQTLSYNLEEIIKRYQIVPNTLKIEITEQTALAGTEKIIGKMHAIKKLGVKLAMDDFGMGHSSLKYLKVYDFDTIKIDGSLTREILSNNTCGEIISSIIFLSKSLGFSVIAEYVETEEQRRELHRLGCNQYQGYLYSPAIPLNELIGYISDNVMVYK